MFEVKVALAAIAFGEPYMRPAKRAFIDLDLAVVAVE
jgi:hypothetical protein